jgi:cyclic 2,3-diphosphoglycerate synthetase
VAEALAAAAREHEIVAVVFCGGSEKVGSQALTQGRETYGYELTFGATPVAALRAALERHEADLLIDLGDEPRVDTRAKLTLAALAGARGLDYQTPGLRIDAPELPDLELALPSISVIGTGKRTGKTAVCGHLARLLDDRGDSPVIVSMGRGGPADPVVARPDTGLDQLMELAATGAHAASDYLEDAAIANVPAVGCRRVAGGPGGRTWHTNFARGVAVAAALPGAGCLLFEGSGATIPPARADATICIVGSPRQALELDGPLRLALADLVMLPQHSAQIAGRIKDFSDARVAVFDLRPTLCKPVPTDASVAFFTTGLGDLHDPQPALVSRHLANREALEQDLADAAAIGCTHYATEIKAAAIDMVAAAAARDGAEVVFVRNEPVSQRDDLDETLVDMHSLARSRRS